MEILILVLLAGAAAIAVARRRNRPPVIDSVTLDPADGRANLGQTVLITVTAHDPEGGPLLYYAAADSGTVAQDPLSPNVFRWTAPA